MIEPWASSEKQDGVQFAKQPIQVEFSDDQGTDICGEFVSIWKKGQRGKLIAWQADKPTYWVLVEGDTIVRPFHPNCFRIPRSA